MQNGQTKLFTRQLLGLPDTAIWCCTSKRVFIN